MTLGTHNNKTTLLNDTRMETEPWVEDPDPWPTESAGEPPENVTGDETVSDYLLRYFPMPAVFV